MAIAGFVAGAILILATLARLVLTNRANVRLYRSLRHAYDALEEKHRRALERAATLEELYSELEAIQGDLIRSNSELVHSRALWERLAVTDMLTDLANHRAFQARLREEVARAQRYSYPFLLLMLDVDDFKPYNDVHGHPAGNQVLHGIAAVMRETVREGDLVARYGGEEFAALLPQTDAKAGRIVAERLRAAVAAHTFPHRRITLSIGGAEYGTDGTDPDTLVASADTALYAAKRAGRNRVVFARDVRVSN